MFRAVLGKAPLRPPRQSWSFTSPKWFHWAVPYLQAISRRAYTYPIHTVVFFALLASTTYVALLETAIFEPPTTMHETGGQVPFTILFAGAKRLYIGPEAQWKWQDGAQDRRTPLHPDSRDLALLTLVFPDTTWDGELVPPPGASSLSPGDASKVEVLPPSTNLLSTISQETTMALSVQYAQAAEFLTTAQELPISDDGTLRPNYTKGGEKKKWVMSAAKGQATGMQRSFKQRVTDAWTAFVDLLKNTEELDVIIMVLGYLSMHLTFVSLFMSLRRLGSNFWLATTVLFSSSFACLFGLIVTIKLGVTLNMVLLSEGLPFLVVIIGFEKPIILTKAVLSASLAFKKQPSVATPISSVSSHRGHSSPIVQSAVESAVEEIGSDIFRDYLIEILILVMGAMSGVQGGLCQFCFLAAWILFFDLILLFTFYTAILTIKLEINRIKRHVALRRALEEDGVSRKVAEEVASSDEWPKASITVTEHLKPPSYGTSLFGAKARDSSISRFKVLMVAGFVGLNVVNLCTIPFRSGIRSTSSTLSSVVSQPPMDPFRVAGSALDRIAAIAKKQNTPTTVTILSPIKYQLEYPSVHYAAPEEAGSSIFENDFADQLLEGMGGKMVEGVLKSFEDPILSKWIIAALAMSLILNGYLFNAARWSITDTTQILTATPFTTVSDDSMLHGGRARSPPVTAHDSGSGRSVHAASENSEDSDHGLELQLTGNRHLKRRQTESESMLREGKAPLLFDEELIELSLRGKIPGYALEKILEDKTRAVKIRRAVVARTPATAEFSSFLEDSKLPFQHFDYDRVHGACCENVIGYLPLPLGVAGPLNVDGQDYYIPMATTEGVLVASTSRGCKAINAGGGAVTVLTGDGMTRGPCVGFSTLVRAGAAKVWLDSEEGQRIMKDAFNSTSRFARLQSMKTALAGTYLYIRFKTTTGDAMGMNMISKGVETALRVMATESGFDDMAIISVSGNYCTDKKPAAINWIDGRGKSVVAEAIIPGDIVRSVLKSDVDALVELNTSKNLIGSAMAGSIGGFNAHAANIVTAVFLATGQDPAQNVESSNCITVMKNYNGSLQISVSMPSIEVGTIGGGTFLPPQAAMLDLLGVRGAHPTSPGDNARQLARIVCAATLAGELSLCSALAAGHLVRAHMQHNRSQVPTRAVTPAPPS